jgi:hypothetical protein
MVIYSDLKISGVSISQVYNYTVDKSISDNNTASTFEATIDNFAGINATSFLIGNEVTVYADSGNNPPTTLIFRGILEDMKYTGDSNMDEQLVLAGRDYIARLQDITIQPTLYSNTEIGSIVRNLMATYVNDVSYSGVHSTTVTLSGINFNQVSLYDSIKQLATLAGDYMFYVDNNKDLKFLPQNSTSSGYIFDSGNTWKTELRGQRDTLANQVWVYGDRYLDAYKETFTAGSPVGGSIFTLLYSPYNAQVTVSGVLIQPGRILGQVNTATSGAKFLVDQNNKQIIFISGTGIGSFVPASGVSVVIDYYRSLPIVKVGDDDISQQRYGLKTKVIQDKSIKDPSTAQALMLQNLTQYSVPQIECNIDVKGFYHITPGNTCVINYPFEGINNNTSTILNATYNFNKDNNLSDRVLSLKVNQKISDINDVIKQAILDLKRIQAADMSTTDIITRFKYSLGSFSIVSSGVVVWTRAINDSFILGHTINGILGSIAGLQPLLGDRRGALTIYFSGAYNIGSPAAPPVYPQLWICG